MKQYFWFALLNMLEFKGIVLLAKPRRKNIQIYSSLLTSDLYIIYRRTYMCSTENNAKLMTFWQHGKALKNF